MINDLATLTWLAQLAALEIHVPQWRFGSDGHPQIQIVWFLISIRVQV